MAVVTRKKTGTWKQKRVAAINHLQSGQIAFHTPQLPSKAQLQYNTEPWIMVLIILSNQEKVTLCKGRKVESAF